MRSRAEYLRILGLPPAATASEIRSAFRDLAQVWHPDRFAHAPELQRKAQDRMKEINEAYDHLKSTRADEPAQPPAADVWNGDPEKRRAAPETGTARPEPEPRTAGRGSHSQSSGSGTYVWVLLALIAAGAWAAFRYKGQDFSSNAVVASETTILGLIRPDRAVPPVAARLGGKDIRAGATPEQVASVLGNPDSIDTMSGLQIWHYGRSTVFLTSGHVTGWQNAGDFLLSANAAKP